MSARPTPPRQRSVRREILGHWANGTLPADALARGGMMRRSWAACLCAAACCVLLIGGGKARAEAPACPSAEFQYITTTYLTLDHPVTLPEEGQPCGHIVEKLESMDKINLPDGTRIRAQLVEAYASWPRYSRFNVVCVLAALGCKLSSEPEDPRSSLK